MNPAKIPPEGDQTASILRHFGALFYDALIIFSLLYVGTALLVPFVEKISFDPHSQLYAAYLVFIWGGYFVYFMSNGRQTIGMRAWRLHCVQFDGQPLSPACAVMRFGFAIPCITLFCFGVLWKLIDPKGIGLHERWSKSYLTPNDPRGV